MFEHLHQWHVLRFIFNFPIFLLFLLPFHSSGMFHVFELVILLKQVKEHKAFTSARAPDGCSLFQKLQPRRCVRARCFVSSFGSRG